MAAQSPRMLRRLLRRLGPAALWAAAGLAGQGVWRPVAAQASDAPASAPGVEFMQGMILHHAQALEMSALVDGRTTAVPLRRLGERITVSQRDEIAMMSAWLRDRGAAVPEPTAGHAHHGHGAMPGMASPEEMITLAAQRGRAFERRFLELMIRHHEGALTMVQGVLRTAGGPDDSELFRFASDVDADQRAEIRRMQAMLAGLASASARATRRRS